MPGVHHVTRASNVAVFAAEDHTGSMLNDGGHRHDELAFGAFDQSIGAAHCKLGAIGQHLSERRDTAPSRLDRDVQTPGAAKTLGLRRAVPANYNWCYPLRSSVTGTTGSVSVVSVLDARPGDLS